MNIVRSGVAFKAALAAAIGLSLTACSTSPPAVTRQYVHPHHINPQAHLLYNYQDVYAAPVGRPLGRLFLFIPGTYAPPRLYSKIISQAALHGYNAISLSYPNWREVRDACRNVSDTNCFGIYRLTVLNGGTSKYVKVAPADAMIHRLIDLLNYANHGDPSAGWGAFASGDTPVWTKIYVGGHSQGGAFALFIAKLHLVAQACAIDAPVDQNGAGVPATWLTMASRTPVSRMFGFANQDDTFAAFHTIAAQWSILHLPGQITDVDHAQPPYGGSHRLVTVVPERVSLRSHDISIMDQATPNGPNGVPLYAPVWRYACFP